MPSHQPTHYPVLVDGKQHVEIPVGGHVTLPDKATGCEVLHVRENNYGGTPQKTVVLRFLREPEPEPEARGSKLRHQKSDQSDPLTSETLTSDF